MIRKGFVLLIAVALLLTALPALAAQQTTTVMMYMCGTDLQSDCVLDIREMCAADLGSNVRVVVLAGGAKKWDDSHLASKQLNLFTIQNGAIGQVTNWGKDSMGSPDTLQKFVTYAWQNFHSDRNILVLWDHGSGSAQGMCFDEVNRDDMLSLVEIDQALANVKKADRDFHLDIFGCDACLMADYEMAVIASNYADYFVASQELEPALGWYYTTWLTTLSKTPSISTADLARTIVDSYGKAVQASDDKEYTTLSAIDLSAIPALQSDIESLAAYLSSALENGQLATIKRMVSRMYAMSSYYASDGDYDMYDLGEFLNMCQQFAPNAVASARTHLQQAVIHTYDSGDLPAATGLSIFIPQESGKSFRSKYLSGYAITQYIPNYVDFVTGMAAKMSGSSYSFTNTSPSSVQASGITNFIYSFIPGATYNAETGESTERPSFIPGSNPAASGISNQLAATTAPGFIPGGNTTQPAGSDKPSFVPGVSISAPDSVSWTPSFIPGTLNGMTAVVPTVNENDLAFSLHLSKEDIENLDYVEGALFMDLSDDDGMCLIDMGYLRNSWVDWEKNDVYSTFDGRWPTLDGQFVTLYDRAVTEISRHSLVPVKVNGEEVYLVVVFDKGSDTGRIVGYNEGVDDKGLLVRRTNPLRPGDVVIPMYSMFYGSWDDFDGDDDLEESDSDGEPIVWRNGLEIVYESLEDEEDSTEYQFAFYLNDIYGDYEMSDFFTFTM